MLNCTTILHKGTFLLISDMHNPYMDKIKYVCLNFLLIKLPLQFES